MGVRRVVLLIRVNEDLLATQSALAFGLTRVRWDTLDTCHIEGYTLRDEDVERGVRIPNAYVYLVRDAGLFEEGQVDLFEIAFKLEGHNSLDSWEHRESDGGRPYEHTNFQDAPNLWMRRGLNPPSTFESCS